MRNSKQETKKHFAKKHLGYFAVICIVLLYLVFALLISVPNSVILDIGNALSDINSGNIDKYFSDDTLLIYGGKEYRYKNVKENIKTVLGLGEVGIPETAFYGHTRSRGLYKAKAVAVGWVHVAGKGSTEMSVHLEFSRKRLFRWKLESILSDDKIFGHIFIDKNIEIIDSKGKN